jgi:hypothetical protein
VECDKRVTRYSPFVRSCGILQLGEIMKSILSLKPVAQSRKGVEYGSGPVMLYEVEGLPEGRAISIRKVRAQSQEPVWQFGVHFKGYPTRWTGAFKTADEALAQLQENLDEADVEVGEIAQ